MRSVSSRKCPSLWLLMSLLAEARLSGSMLRLWMSAAAMMDGLGLNLSISHDETSKYSDVDSDDFHWLTDAYWERSARSMFGVFPHSMFPLADSPSIHG